MRIYSLPKEVPAPKVDYSKYDPAKVDADEKKHMADLKAWATGRGYSGKYTGEIYSESVADGSALYMAMDAGRQGFALVHLPYGDAYQSRDVGFLTKTEIVRRIEADKKFNALWTKK